VRDRYQPLVGASQSDTIARDSSCELPCPLLRWTSRLAALVRRGRRPHGNDAEPARPSATTCRRRKPSTDERVEHSVVGDTADLAQCLQDAARPAGSTVASDARVRRGDFANWTVEELLPLVVKGRVIPLALFMVRPVSADAVICLS
jgi:class 3 adenylate cyclase